MAHFIELQNERDIADYKPKLMSKKSAERAIKEAQNSLSIIQKVYHE